MIESIGECLLESAQRGKAEYKEIGGRVELFGRINELDGRWSSSMGGAASSSRESSTALRANL